MRISIGEFTIIVYSIAVLLAVVILVLYIRWSKKHYNNGQEDGKRE